MKNIFWTELQVVIFDVDGTLYQQSKLRRIMFIKLIVYYLLRPWKYRELVILYHFRKEREKRAGYTSPDLEEEQYLWCVEKTGAALKTVKEVIDQWIFEWPNRYLEKCMYPDVRQFFSTLKKYGIKTAIYSDYKSADKLKHMQIQADMEISSTDKRVNSFKPLPNGLLEILSAMNITERENCLYIGDRFELDGLCAKAAGIPFLLVDQTSASTDFYGKLAQYLIKSRN